MKRQAVLLSAALSIASITSSMASCAAMQPAPRPVVDEPARFCYQTLGEITCYTAPQPQMGNIVALPPEPAREPQNAADVSTADEPVATAPAKAPSAAPSAPAKSQKPISLKPEA